MPTKDIEELGHKMMMLALKGKLPLPMGGHFRSEHRKNEKKNHHDNMDGAMIGHVLQSKGPHLLKIFFDTNAKPSKKPVEFWVGCYECFDCGQRIRLSFDGKTFTCVNPCKHPNGHPAYEFELNVPSGKMVVGNDFRDKFDITGNYDINTLVGMAKTSFAYAKIGMAHAFVGNTCPGVYRISNDKFVIGTCVEKFNEDDDKDEIVPPVAGAERVGGICTDLWWYSIVDYDDYVKAYGVPTKKDRFIDVVDCKPGVYKFHHQYHLVNDDNYDEPKVYTKIAWIGENRKKKDHRAKYLAKNITAGQALKASVDSNDMEEIKKHASYLLLGSAGHHHYHPNGWICGNPEVTSKSPSMKIPVFKGKMPFADISEYTWLVQMAGVGKPLGAGLDATKAKLNKSFIELAFNICQAYIRYGAETSSLDTPERTKKNLDIMKQTFLALAKKHPVPKYCKDLITK